MEVLAPALVDDLQQQETLEGANLSQARDEVAAALERTIDEYTADDYAEDFDVSALVGALAQIYPVSIPLSELEAARADVSRLVELVTTDAIANP